jgi:hypothetical protein
MRLIIVLIVALWGIASLLAFVRTQGKAPDAKLTAAYVLLWPALVVILLLNEPVPMWIAVPAIFGFIPWLLAGAHLWAILADKAAYRSDEIMGTPKVYWTWGGLGAILLGILLS